MESSSFEQTSSNKIEYYRYENMYPHSGAGTRVQFWLNRDVFRRIKAINELALRAGGHCFFGASCSLSWHGNDDYARRCSARKIDWVVITPREMKICFNQNCRIRLGAIQCIPFSLRGNVLLASKRELVTLSKPFEKGFGYSAELGRD